MKTSPLSFLIFTASILMFTACKSEDDIITLSPTLGLLNLEAGQKIKYQEIRVDFNRDSISSDLIKDCYYGTKILTLEVIEKTDEGLVIKEYLQDQSIYEVGELALTIKDDIIDVVQLEDKSKYGSSIFHLKTFNIAPVSDPLGRVEEDCFYNEIPEKVGAENNTRYAVKQVRLGEKVYENLFVFHHDAGMESDGPGYSYLFSKDAAIVRSTTYGGFFPYLKGWELMPEEK